MEKDIKIFLAKILGEIYRIQKRIKDLPCSATDSHIYGLLKGFEDSINLELDYELITKQEVSKVSNILNEIWIDDEKLKNFKGYYDIESEFEKLNIPRWKIILILTKLKSEDRYTRLLEKMDSNNSPGECRKFDIESYFK
jgi:hypothetical protein